MVGGASVRSISTVRFGAAWSEGDRAMRVRQATRLNRYRLATVLTLDSWALGTLWTWTMECVREVPVTRQGGPRSCGAPPSARDAVAPRRSCRAREIVGVYGPLDRAGSGLGILHYCGGTVKDVVAWSSLQQVELLLVR